MVIKISEMFGDVAELASAYVVHIRELGSNLSADKIFSKIRPVL
jgi:hypothetical protein